jgi:hypothetical protein
VPEESDSDDDDIAVGESEGVETARLEDDNYYGILAESDDEEPEENDENEEQENGALQGGDSGNETNDGENGHDWGTLPAYITKSGRTVRTPEWYTYGDHEFGALMMDDISGGYEDLVTEPEEYYWETLEMMGDGEFVDGEIMCVKLP